MTLSWAQIGDSLGRIKRVIQEKEREKIVEGNKTQR